MSAADMFLRPSSGRLRSPPSLFQLASKAVATNIAQLNGVGNIPFFVVSNLLSTVSPAHLARIEQNSHFAPNETEELWKKHCSKQPSFCRPKDPSVTWRELYHLRLADLDERRQRAASRIMQTTSRQASDKSARKVVVIKTAATKQTSPSLRTTFSSKKPGSSAALQAIRAHCHRKMVDLQSAQAAARKQLNRQ
jgi:elongin-A